MAFRRFNSSSRGSSRSRFRRTPLAQRQRYWIQKIGIATENAPDVTVIQLLAWADIPGLGSMAALSKGIRLRRCIYILRSTTDDVAQNREYGVNLDDLSDAVAATAWNPGAITAANQRIPNRVFRWGGLTVPSTASLAAGFNPYVGNVDLVRDIKLNGFMRPDQALLLNIAPALSAGDQVQWTCQSRVLIEIG